MRSLWTKNNRQSPWLDAVLSVMAIPWLLVCANSEFRLLRTFALLTSLSVNGMSPRDSSVFTRASRAASSFLGGQDANPQNRPGSCALSEPADALVASFDSTRA